MADKERKNLLKGIKNSVHTMGSTGETPQKQDKRPSPSPAGKKISRKKAPPPPPLSPPTPPPGILATPKPPQLREEQRYEALRAHTRIDFEIEVSLESEHNFYTGLTQNISAGGVFIATNLVVELGDQLTITLALPGMKEAVPILCEVRWIRPLEFTSKDMPPGFGANFLDLPEEIEHEVEDFIQSRETIFFE